MNKYLHSILDIIIFRYLLDNSVSYRDKSQPFFHIDVSREKIDTIIPMIEKRTKLERDEDYPSYISVIS